MTEPHPELITICKQDLLEFVASIGFQIEEYQAQNLTRGFEISGYQDAGDCFIIVLRQPQSAKESSDKVLDGLEKWLDTRWRYYAKNPVYYYDELKRELRLLRQQGEREQG